MRHAAREPRDFTIGVRPQAADDAERYFDRLWRAKGVDYSKLTRSEQRAYVRARGRYMHTCAALHASPEKQRELERRLTGLVPSVDVSTTPVAVAARPRESRSRRRGDATSRGGASGDKPRSSDDPDLAAPGRARRATQSRFETLPGDTA
jgi:hypothetical protein